MGFVIYFLALFLVLPHLLQTGVIMAGGRVLKFDVTFRRALITPIAMTAASIAFAIVLVVLNVRLESVIFIFALLAAPSIAVLNRLLKINVPKTFLLWGVMITVNLGVAVLLRATLVIAYVIPTGSMASAVIGDHVAITCSNCHRSFNVDEWLIKPGGGEHYQCLNCGEIGTAEPLILEGDRVLVDRLATPQRWDIFAFQATHVDESVIYLKRAVGLPGEMVELADGDVFIDGKRIVKPANAYDDLWHFVGDSAFVGAETAETAEQFGWHASTQAPGWQRDGSTWTSTAANSKEQAIRFATKITNQLQYSAKDNQWAGSSSNLPVRDIRVDLHLQGFTGNGQGEIAWSFQGRVFHVTFTPAGELEFLVDSQSKKIASIGKPVGVGDVLTFALRDGVASLLINNQPMIVEPIDSQLIVDHRGNASAGDSGDSSDSNNSNNANANDENNASRQTGFLSIIARDCALSVSRILVQRDVYYVSKNISYGPCTGCTNNPIRLRDDEFFALGDNSANALDSRSWRQVSAKYQGTQIGTVPKRAIVGVARVMYWPLDRMRLFE